MRVAYLLGIVHEVCLASPQVYLGIWILLCSLGVGSYSQSVLSFGVSCLARSLIVFVSFFRIKKSRIVMLLSHIWRIRDVMMFLTVV